MLEIIAALGDYGIEIVKYIVRIVTISLGTLGVIYILGRMFVVNISDKTKNILAVILMFIFSFCVTYLYFSEGYSIYKILWETFIFAVISCVVYVLVCWRLFKRMDSFLDKRFGKD